MRRRVLVAALAILVAAGAFASRGFLRGLSFVIRAADVHGVARRAADIGATAIAEHGLSIPTPRGQLRARLYEPGRGHQRAALLVSGLHPAGIDEPRLVALARELAASGLAVVTPDIPELSRFDITPAITTSIVASGVWLADASGLAPDHRAALMGVSFSGGLAVVAAGRPELRGRVAYVFSFGGHDDLPRVLRYLCSGQEPAPPARGGDLRSGPAPPHDYGVAVILLGLADRVVPPNQVEPLRTAVRRFLWASHLDRVDPLQAKREFEALRELARSMPEPSATLLGLVNARDVASLGPRLLPYIDQYGDAGMLSPSRASKPSAPVFLLHGTDDNVVPAAESVFLARDLDGHAPVRLLLSDLISHAEADRPMKVRDVVALANFWGDLLGR